LIESVEDREGHVVWRPQDLSCACDNPAAPPVITDDRPQIADPQSTFQLINMMEGVMQRGTGKDVAKGIDHVLAGKTGTSQDFTDAWFSGFSPQLVTTVWVGFDNPSTLGNNETGAEVAGPIWHQFMAAALKGKPKLSFPQPPGVTMASWQTSTGTVTDAFKPGQVPGASGPLDQDQTVAAGGNPDGAAQPAATGGAPGVDTSLGGLY
jgi:penicillin-binding protein 1A